MTSKMIQSMRTPRISTKGLHLAQHNNRLRLTAFLSTARVLRCHSIVSSSRTVKPCRTWGVDEMDNEGQHGRRSVPLHYTHKSQKSDTTLVSRRGNVRHQCRGGQAGPTRCLAGLFQGAGSRMKVWGLVVLSNHSAFHCGDPPRAPHFCCCCQMN